MAGAAGLSAVSPSAPAAAHETTIAIAHYGDGGRGRNRRSKAFQEGLAGVRTMRARSLVTGVVSRTKILTVLAVLAPLISPVHAIGADQTPVGLWQAVDDKTKEATGWFLIADHDGVYDGIIAKMFLQPGEQPGRVCDQCQDDRKDHPWLGLEIIRGMKPEGEDKFGGGTILDPRDGKIYHATMKITPDGQTLVVRGYIGIELLGQNQYWTRLPDSDMSQLDPSVNPNPPPPVPPAKRPAAAQHKSQGPAMMHPAGTATGR
jgi:uncharacterized protein (DUF2147 family)